MHKVSVSVYLDTRRKKKNGSYPVSLRVYHNRKTKHYKTRYELTESDFERCYLSDKPRGDLKLIKQKIQFLEAKANSIVNDLNPFTFERFEKRMVRSTGEGNNVFYHYTEAIERLKALEKVNTAKSYSYAQKALKDYLTFVGRKNVSSLSFDDVTVHFLNDFQKWILTVQGNSRTTVGIYLRTLRAIFNKAMADENLPRELYPFGKDKFKVPGGAKVKKALTREQLKKMMAYDLPTDSPMAKARALWFFMYCCNGMNIRDVCDLKGKHYTGKHIVFHRHKTLDTTKENLKTITAVVTEPVREVVIRYGNKGFVNDTYVFPFFNEAKTEEERVKKLGHVTKYINKYIKELAKKTGLPEGLSTNWARHTFSSIAVNLGASLEFVQESLGHADIKTTQIYFQGFESDFKHEMANKLTSFLEDVQ